MYNENTDTRSRFRSVRFHGIMGEGSMNAGHVFVLIGPSGTGKTTLAERCRRDGLAQRIATCTTRSPRLGEVDGRDYHFLTPSQFEEAWALGHLVEREAIHGHWYGVPVEEISRALQNRRILVVPMGYGGAGQLKRLYARHVTVIAIQPPDVETLRQRLQARGTPSSEIEARLAAIQAEWSAMHQADHVIVNVDLERAYRELQALIRAVAPPDESTSTLRAGG